MRIVHIISGLNTGGAERMLLNMIKTCKDKKTANILLFPYLAREHYLIHLYSRE